MNELEALQNELCIARQNQADAEFARELAGKINAKVSEATGSASFERLKILEAYINKSLELVGILV